MSKHTPGPWIQVRDGRSVCAPSFLGVSVAFCGDCTVVSKEGKYSISKDEAQANARLVAAAPDLLEALLWLADWSETDPNAPGDLSAREVARAAIVKAEGGS